jgi:hypothetical protein
MTQLSVETPELPSLEEEGWIKCDSCSARAVMKVFLPFGGLTFCNHHYNKNADALTKQGGIAKLLGI